MRQVRRVLLRDSHNSELHQSQVLALAERLRRDGIDDRALCVKQQIGIGGIVVDIGSNDEGVTADLKRVERTLFNPGMAGLDDDCGAPLPAIDCPQLAPTQPKMQSTANHNDGQIIGSVQ